MRDPARIDRMIDKLTEVWKSHPDWRLSQLVHNVASYDGRQDIFYVEDDITEARLNEILDRDPYCNHPGVFRGEVCPDCGLRV